MSSLWPGLIAVAALTTVLLITGSGPWAMITAGVVFALATLAQRYA